MKEEDTRYYVCCPGCGRRLFKGKRFDIDIECPKCKIRLSAEKEQTEIRICLNEKEDEQVQESK